MTQREIFSVLEACDGFEWDAGNLYKAWTSHKVLPDECHEAFSNRPRFAIADEKHSGKESRYILYGQTNRGRRLTIVCTVRRNKIRVISPRDMSKREKAAYDEAAKGNTNF
jgi:uncharacterized DUF497 family protein